MVVSGELSGQGGRGYCMVHDVVVPPLLVPLFPGRELHISTCCTITVTSCGRSILPCPMTCQPGRGRDLIQFQAEALKATACFCQLFPFPCLQDSLSQRHRSFSLESGMRKAWTNNKMSGCHRFEGGRREAFLVQWKNSGWYCNSGCMSSYTHQNSRLYNQQRTLV